MGNDDDVADRRKVLGSLMFAQIMGGIFNGVAFSMSSLPAAAMAGAAWGGMGATLTMLGMPAMAWIETGLLIAVGMMFAVVRRRSTDETRLRRGGTKAGP